jgi:parvulin-like peptidyl-prolyl isomerase
MSEKEETNNTSDVKKSKTTLFGLLAVVVVAVLVYISVSVFGIGDGKDSIAAKVNGEIILQSELDQRFDQDTKRAIAQGIDTSNSEIAAQVKLRILEELINSKLLIQAAKKSGIEIDSDTVDSEIALAEQQIGGKEALLAQLSEVGMDEDEFKEEVFNQLMIQQYLLENIDIDSTVATEEEIVLAYEKASAATENIPPLSEIKEQISGQITVGKQQKLLDALIESLRKDAEIEIL